MTLGKALKRLRLAAGHKQKDFARALDVSASYLSLIEADKRTPSVQLLRDASGILGVPAAILFALLLAEDIDDQSAAELRTVLDRLTETTSLNLAQLAFGLAPVSETT